MSIFNEKTLTKKIRKSEGVILSLPKKLKTDNISFGITEIHPGKSTVNHNHEIAEEFIYIISGKGTARIDSHNYRISKGDILFIDNMQFHKISNESGEILKILFGISPPLNI